MVPVNKDTLFIVAAIVFALGLIYMFKELKQAKEDIEGFKGFSAQVSTLSSTPRAGFCSSSCT